MEKNLFRVFAPIFCDRRRFKNLRNYNAIYGVRAKRYVQLQK